MILMWPFCVVTLWIITDLHLAQIIAIASPGLRASASFLVLISLRNCRSLGDAAMPSPPVGLYWACTGPAKENMAIPASAAIRALFVVFIIDFLSSVFVVGLLHELLSFSIHSIRWTSSHHSTSLGKYSPFFALAPGVLWTYHRVMLQEQGKKLIEQLSRSQIYED